MKSIISFFVVFAISGLLQSQPLTPSVIGSAGHTAVNGEYQLSWTAGEVAITTAAAENFILTQGFHQPTDIITKIAGPVAAENNIIRLFPNPANEFLQLTAMGKEKLKITVTDATGRQMMHLNVSPDLSNYSIDLSDYSNGVYFFHVANASETIVTTYRILKIS